VELPVVNYLGSSSVAELVTQLGAQPVPTAFKSGLPNRSESTTATWESTMRSLQPPVSTQPLTFPKLEEEVRETLSSRSSDSSRFQNPLPIQVSPPLPPPSLVPLQPVGTKPPFFCVHPVSGVVFPYYELACQLGSERPFYGLQSAGIEGEEQPLTRIEDMARHYIKAIRIVQPEGPYFLGGWSFGACAAFEMAQQLQRDGQQVAMLVLLDTSPPSTDKTRNVFDLFRFFFTEALPEIWPYVYDYFYLAIAAKNQQQTTDKGERIWDKLHLSVRAAEIAKVVARESRLMRMRQPTVRRILRIIQLNSQAVINYAPQVYPGRITLFRTSNQIGIGKNRLDPTLGWSELAAQGVEIHQIPGAHLNLLRKPHVQVVAENLKACLNQIQFLEKGGKDSK
jgi:thioesterase domain-containing protein